MSPHSKVVCAAELLLLVCDNLLKADDRNFEETLEGYYGSHPVCGAIALTFPGRPAQLRRRRP